MTIDEAKRLLAAISPNPLARPEDFNVTSVIETITEIKGKRGPETGDPAAYREAAPAGVRGPATESMRLVPRFTQEG